MTGYNFGEHVDMRSKLQQENETDMWRDATEGGYFDAPHGEMQPIVDAAETADEAEYTANDYDNDDYFGDEYEYDE